MFFRKNKKSVISLSEDSIKYVCLSRFRKKYIIEHYDKANIKGGVIRDGEVLQIEFLSQVLAQIQKKLETRHVDVLLPHRFFLHEKVQLDIPYQKNIKKMKQAFYKHVTKNIERYPWVTSHSFELMFYKGKVGSVAHVQMLTQENYRALHHAFDKAGFTIGAVHSEDFAFEHLFSKDKKTLHIRIMEETTRLSLFDRGVHVMDTDIDFSYSSLCALSKKTKSTEVDISEILKHHGFLPNHEFDDVYRVLSQSLTSMLMVLRKYVDDSTHVQVSFESYVIPGFVDTLKKTFHAPITLIDPAHFPQYLFSHIRSIHAKNIPTYTTCILYLLRKMS